MDRTALGRAARKTAVAAAVLGAVAPTAGCGVFSSGVDQETPVAMTVSSDTFAQNEGEEIRNLGHRLSTTLNMSQGYEVAGWSSAFLTILV